MRDILFVCIIDSFHYLHNEDLNETIDLSRNNIAWETDREVRFRNDSNLAGDLDGTNAPPNWPYNVSGESEENDAPRHLCWYNVFSGVHVAPVL